MKNFPPNMVILIIVLLLASSAVAVYFNRQTISVSKPVEKSGTPSPENSQAPTLAASAEYSASNSGDSGEVSAPASSISPSSDYIYPGSSVVKNSQGNLELESNADAGVITNWYKDRIRQSSFNAKSFSQTKTNGVIFNKLSGAKPGEKIEITIKKDQNVSKVTITVDRS